MHGGALDLPRFRRGVPESFNDLAITPGQERRDQWRGKLKTASP